MTRALPNEANTLMANGSLSPLLPAPRVLLIEDEYLIAVMVADMVADLACECIGPILTMEEGIKAAKSVVCDAAIINLIIQGRYAYEITEILADRSIPFCFASGVPQAEIDEKWRSRPFIAKPYTLENVSDFLLAVLPSWSR